MEIISCFEVGDAVYKTYSWPDVEFIDNSVFTDALPIGSYVD